MDTKQINFSVSSKEWKSFSLFCTKKDLKKQDALRYLVSNAEKFVGNLIKKFNREGEAME